MFFLVHRVSGGVQTIFRERDGDGYRAQQKRGEEYRPSGAGPDTSGVDGRGVDG